MVPLPFLVSKGKRTSEQANEPAQAALSLPWQSLATIVRSRYTFATFAWTNRNGFAQMEKTTRPFLGIEMVVGGDGDRCYRFIPHRKLPSVLLLLLLHDHTDDDHDDGADGRSHDFEHFSRGYFKRSE